MVTTERSARPRVLITGANRGIGLALTRTFAAHGWQVDACCRAPERAAALRSLATSNTGRIVVRRVDVADLASIDALAREVGDGPIDLLLNNAGVMSGATGVEASDRTRTDQQFGKLDFEAWMRVMRINLLGPARMSEVFADHVARSTRKTIAIVSSIRGSITSIDASGPYHYCTSKTAVNMLMRNICVELGPRGIIAVSLHPGWARTDMGGAGAPVAVEDSARGLFKVLDELTPAQAGRFFTWEGKTLEW